MKTVNKFQKQIFLFQLMALHTLVGIGEIYAQSESSSNHLTLQHITLVVSDFAKSKNFYTEVLQLEEIEADWLPEKMMFLSLGDGLELHVGEIPGVPITPNDINHFAITPVDFEGYLQYLKSKGVTYSSLGGENEFEIIERPDGVLQTYIEDPDGYWIEINNYQ